ncbi:DUF484 family protein [Beggiatoa leptomitoformis]|uniref:DUF484 family protein n=1 Tax=Beggiatoa leptomitoformis TaxID=288004 RepID=A0A2N9YGA1_9GAMM|nr:DUF484 family protein [Beggiatoa leptomitoformis]ALG68180.1 DUF484 family protein [Beggiatoa leptomitoformis]AUI69517.1 DUF484 family protein [Beggiatoa leptomitoformis]
MSTQTLIDEMPEEDAIVEYLKRHPKFFSRHENLLAVLEIPHQQKGSAVSLVERQLMVLREENQQLQRKLDNLIAIAKQNELLNQRIQRLISVLAAAASADEFFNMLYSTLHKEFGTDAVVVKLFDMPNPVLAGRQEFVEYDAQVFTLFETLLGTNHPSCGRLSHAQTDYLFPQSRIASAVLIPLGVPKANGILAMGSNEVSRFHAGMGTDLLKYMGDLISHLLKPWLRGV